jgi:hypothetical protein
VKMKEPRRIAAVWAVMLALLAGALSCSGPVVTAVGDSNDLVIIHSDGQERLLEPVVSAMELPVEWLLGEPLFDPTLATPAGAKELRNIRHILLVGTWDEDDLAGFARQAFPKLGPNDPIGLRLTEDVWAKGQLVGAIMGSTEEEVLAFLDERGPEAAREFAAAAVRRLAERLKSDADESGMTATMLERFGWSLAPPTGYDFYTTNESDRFVFFRRVRPDRTVFVYWEEGEPGVVTDDFAVARREELASTYLDGDTIERRRPLDIRRVDFLGRQAVRLSGWWANRELIGGGTFISYCFYEPSQGRVYIVDVSLFAPGFSKMSLMRNLDAIAHTFATGSGDSK